MSNHKEVFDNVVRSLKEGGGFANGLEALLKEHNLSDFRVTSIGLQRVKSGPELKCPAGTKPVWRWTTYPNGETKLEQVCE